MKARYLIIILLTICVAPGYSQASGKQSGFTDIRLSYIISSMSAGGGHFRKGESIIPYGAGLELTFKLNKRFSFDVGSGVRTHWKRIYQSSVISWRGYSGPVYHEDKSCHIDIPVHINFKILNTKPLKITIFTGPKGTVFNFRGYFDPDYSGRTYTYHGNSFSAGLDFGLTESLRITGRLGIFASQYYGYYLLGNYSECETINFKIGMLYNIQAGIMGT